MPWLTASIVLAPVPITAPKSFNVSEPVALPANPVRPPKNPSPEDATEPGILAADFNAAFAAFPNVRSLTSFGWLSSKCQC